MLIKSISGIRGTIGGNVGESLTPVDIVKFATGYALWVKQQAAPKNSILVSSAIRNLIKNKFETSSPIEVKAKGIDKPISSYVLNRQESQNIKVIKELDGLKLEYDPKKIDKNKLLEIISELEN